MCVFTCCRVGLEGPSERIRRSSEAVPEDTRREEPGVGEIPGTHQEVRHRLQCGGSTQRPGGSAGLHRERSRRREVSHGHHKNFY